MNSCSYISIHTCINDAQMPVIGRVIILYNNARNTDKVMWIFIIFVTHSCILPSMTLSEDFSRMHGPSIGSLHFDLLLGPLTSFEDLFRICLFHGNPSLLTYTDIPHSANIIYVLNTSVPSCYLLLHLSRTLSLTEPAYSTKYLLVR